MRRKMIDDYRIVYLNYLFDINLIFVRSKSYVPTSSICMNASFLGMRHV